VVQLGEFEQALSWYDRAAETLEGVLRVNAKDANSRRFLLNTLAGRQDVLLKLNRTEEASRDRDRISELRPEGEGSDANGKP
jgi:hypothetical protein